LEQAIMSIGSIGAYSNWWQSQNQATAGSSAATATSSSSSIPNTGSLAATSNMSTFMQSFSADLQSMLTQLGNETGSSATSSATTSATSASSGSGNVDQTGTVQAQGAEHHHHHHHAGGAGEGGSPQNAANQLVGETGQSLQGGTLSASQIGQSANAFAADVMQALQSYATTPASASGSSILA
jgi:hypothetical protein